MARWPRATARGGGAVGLAARSNGMVVAGRNTMEVARLAQGTATSWSDGARDVSDRRRKGDREKMLLAPLYLRDYIDGRF